MANATAQNVDFSNVKDGGNFNRKRIPQGDYLAKITKIEDAKAKDGIFQYLVSIKIVSHATAVLPYYCKLQENQLWKLRNLLIAGGLSVPKKRTKVDPNRLVGKLIGVTIEDDEFEGKEQSSIAAVFPAAELPDGDSPAAADDDDEGVDEDDTDIDMGDDSEDAEEATEDEAEEEPEAEEEAEDEEEEAEEEPEGDEFDAMDRVALKAALKKRDASFVAKKSQTDDDLRALLREAPAAKAVAKAAPAKKAATTKKKAAEVTDDELEELNIDDL